MLSSSQQTVVVNEMGAPKKLLFLTDNFLARQLLVEFMARFGVVVEVRDSFGKAVVTMMNEPIVVVLFDTVFASRSDWQAMAQALQLSPGNEDKTKYVVLLSYPQYESAKLHDEADALGMSVIHVGPGLVEKILELVQA